MGVKSAGKPQNFLRRARSVKKWPPFYGILRTVKTQLAAIRYRIFINYELQQAQLTTSRAPLSLFFNFDLVIIKSYHLM